MDTDQHRAWRALCASREIRGAFSLVTWSCCWRLILTCQHDPKTPPGPTLIREEPEKKPAPTCVVCGLHSLPPVGEGQHTRLHPAVTLHRKTALPGVPSSGAGACQSPCRGDRACAGDDPDGDRQSCRCRPARPARHKRKAPPKRGFPMTRAPPMCDGIRSPCRPFRCQRPDRPALPSSAVRPPWLRW